MRLKQLEKLVQSLVEGGGDGGPAEPPRDPDLDRTIFQIKLVVYTGDGSQFILDETQQSVGIDEDRHIRMNAQYIIEAGEHVGVRVRTFGNFTGGPTMDHEYGGYAADSLRVTSPDGDSALFDLTSITRAGTGFGTPEVPVGLGAVLNGAVGDSLVLPSPDWDEFAVQVVPAGLIDVALKIGVHGAEHSA